MLLVLALGSFALCLGAHAQTGNTKYGSGALSSNTTGDYNTAIGYYALLNNTIGYSNTANGYYALLLNSTGYSNTANGSSALRSNDTGYFNTANGSSALYRNDTGYWNTANGSIALNFNTTGFYNTANGTGALYYNTTGSNNIALGTLAGYNLTTGSYNIDIGNVGVAGDGGRIRIGTAGKQTATYIAGISGVGVTGSAVLVSSTGKLGIMTSSARYKEGIKPMDKASEALLALKPVTFRYKHDLDPDGFPQFGLIAEQVEKVDPNLVVRDEDGKVSTVRYEAVNAMLLNEFLKEHSQVEELKASGAKQAAMIAQMKKQIDALTATVQKVSDKIELRRPAPQLVGNDR